MVLIYSLVEWLYRSSPNRGLVIFIFLSLVMFYIFSIILYQCKSKNCHLVVMGNVIPNELDYQSGVVFVSLPIDIRGELRIVPTWEKAYVSFNFRRCSRTRGSKEVFFFIFFFSSADRRDVRKIIISWTPSRWDSWIKQDNSSRKRAPT